MTKPLILVLLTVSTASCALIARTYDIQIPPSVNPDVGIAVKIVGVTDRRRFTSNSNAVYLAKPGEDTDRLIGRVPGSSEVTHYAGIFLPEGNTVGALSVDAVVRGLQSGGFRVLRAGDPDFDSATPLEVSVEAFWVDIRLGNPCFEVRVVIEGPIPRFVDGMSFGNQTIGKHKNFFNPVQTTTSSFKPTIRAGLENLEKEIAARVKAS